ncbi:YwaF family protein [Mycoplasmatota bacterium]|nr:YwaF family protein [Mycoplasmatota bacterium]
MPLQICHFANFVLLYAFVKDSKSVFGFALMFNLPAAFLSILFADGLENYDTILSFRGIAYIFGHMLIVSTTLWAFIEKFAILDKKTYQNTLSITFVLSVFVNNLFSIFNIGHANFFYSARPQGGTPLETFFLWGANITIGDQFMINPIYLIMMILTGLVLISSMYGLFKDIEKAAERQPSLNTVSNHCL